MNTMNMCFTWTLATLLLLSPLPGRGEVFTSVVDLQNILYAEQDLSEVLADYVASERERLDKLEAVVADFREHSRAALAEPDRKLGNLVSAFKTVKRFTVDWERVLDTYIHNYNVSQLHIAAMARVSAAFPCVDDLKTAAASLLRIQDTYALEPVSMARGEVKGMLPGEELDAGDCFELGRLAYEENDYYHAIAWMEHAMVLSREEGDASTVDKGLLFDYLNFAHFQEKNIHRARELCKEWLDMDPTCDRAKNNMVHYNRMIEDEDCADAPERPGSKPKLHLERHRNEWQQGETFANYEKLCRGEEVDLNKHVRHKLYCSYKSFNPMFILSPLKEEILSFDPPVKVFHDILTEEEMTTVKTLAIPKLHRSGVFQTSERSNPFTQFRISKTSWIKDVEHPLIRRVSLKAGAVANLTTETVEDLQVVNYGIGGHYEPHYDFSRAGESGSFVPGHGNRIATVIFYVDDVEAGGSTVFPDLGVAVKPEKGACAVWYNLLRSGEGDFRTIHAGCPVLTGMKWIATKWFHEGGNEWNRSCDLDPNV